MTRWRRIQYQPNLPLGADGKHVTACPEHIELSKNAAKEGMVLLKNDGKLLPFSKGTRLALFGISTFDYVKGGGGSGDVTVEYEVDLYEGFRKLNGYVELSEELADFYRAYIRRICDTFYWPGQKPEPQLPDDLCQRIRAYTDTAVISVSRLSGEGWDRDLKGHPMYEEGDFYLFGAERAMVEQVKKYFPKIAVVLNVGGMVDTQWFCHDDAIQSVLLAWQGGMEGGTAAAELLCGFGNPCGKLVDTFAKQLEDYPSTEGFHESDAYVDYTATLRPSPALGKRSIIPSATVFPIRSLPGRSFLPGRSAIISVCKSRWRMWVTGPAGRSSRSMQPRLRESWARPREALLPIKRPTCCKAGKASA